MIKITTLDNRVITINVDIIERIEAVPETVITLTNGKKLMVREKMDDIIKKVIQYKAEILRTAGDAEEVM